MRKFFALFALVVLPASPAAAIADNAPQAAAQSLTAPAQPQSQKSHGIVGSPHDIAAQGYAVLGKEEEKERKKRNVCNYCHVPHKAKGIRLWPTPPPSLKGWGKVGPLCYSCHDGVAIVSPNVDMSNTVFNSKSHGLELDNLPEGDSVNDSDLPYTRPPEMYNYTGSETYASHSKELKNIECTTCHNPHDDTNRPFLRLNINEICEKCHKDRENTGFGINNNGTHPVHVQYKNSDSKSARPLRPLEDIRWPPDSNDEKYQEKQYPQPYQFVFAEESSMIKPHTQNDRFIMPIPKDGEDDYPEEGGKDAKESVHWRLGGHLSQGYSGTVECTTCHAVHGRHIIGPPPDKGKKLLAIAAVKKDSDEFCEGCHRGKRGDSLAEPPYPNPGGTTLPRTYHPADDDNSNGPGRIVEIKDPEGWVFGKEGQVLCTTCHKPHRALKNSPILRPPVESATFCESCHSVPFPHHPTGDITGPGSINSGDTHAKTRQPQIPAAFPAGITYGAPEPGKIYCSTCHRAHNAACQPILVIDCAQGDSCSICLQCHLKYNPTWQTDPNYLSTHFLGDPTATLVEKATYTGQLSQTNQGYEIVGTQPGYYDQYPPTNTNPWPESHLSSKFGGPEGKEITCCSCHSFATGNITGGDADQSPYLGPILAPGYQPSDLVSGLLARAGSFKEWLDNDVFQVTVGGGRGTINKVDKYLCTGCHGLTPNTRPSGGEGLTHPLMNADAMNPDYNEGIASAAMQPADPAKLTYNKHINCESCHSPHEADSKGGFFILRKVERYGMQNLTTAIVDPYSIRQRTDIEFAPLCQLCHIDH